MRCPERRSSGRQATGVAVTSAGVIGSWRIRLPVAANTALPMAPSMVPAISGISRIWPSGRWPERKV
jgi:hypothetical protein